MTYLSIRDAAQRAPPPRTVWEMTAARTVQPPVAMVITAAILGPLLRSDDPDTIRLAIDALKPILLEHDGNLLQIAKATGIAHRTLARWMDVPEFRRAVTNARKSAPIA